MRTFLGEEERSEEIATAFKEQLDYCENIHRYWMGEEHDYYAKQANLDGRVYRCCCALNIQAIRLFRSIVEECKRGEAFSASILCRSLFETVVALTFVLKPKVAIRLYPAKDKKTGQQIVDSDGRLAWNAHAVPLSKAKAKDLLPRELRALFYLAHPFIADEQQAAKFGKKQGLKKFHRGAKKHVDPKDMTDIEKDIGPAWSHVLRSAKNYHGLRISDLSRHLHPGLGKWYDTIYHVQSGDAHAAMAYRRHVRKVGERFIGEVLSDDQAVLNALKAACILFCGLMQTMEDYVGYGPGNPSALAQFDRDYARIFRGKK